MAFPKKYGVLSQIGKPLSALFVAGLLSCGTAYADDRPLRIAALGDSLTEGYGLVAQDGFTAQLQKWLDVHQINATIVNAGVSGDTTAGGFSRVDWTLTPDIGAMIVALGGNDLLRGLSPDLSKQNLAGILRVAQEKAIPVLLIGMKAPGNFGADYQAQFDAIYPDLATEYGALFFDGFLTPLTDQAPWESVLETYMQPDGIHPNAQGVAKIVEAIGPAVAELATQATARP